MLNCIIQRKSREKFFMSALETRIQIIYLSLTKAVLTSPDENPFGKPVYVRGVLYLDDVPEDDSANDAGDSSVDKPGDADNEEPENGGGNNDADLPPEREEAPSEYENDGNTATIGYGELKTLGAESRYEEIKMLNGMKDNVLSVGFVLLIP